MSTSGTSAIVNTSSMSSLFTGSSSLSSSSSSSTNHPIVDVNANNVAVSVLGATSNTTISSSSSSSSSTNHPVVNANANNVAVSVLGTTSNTTSSSSSSSSSSSIPQSAPKLAIGNILGYIQTTSTYYDTVTTEHSILNNERDLESFLTKKEVPKISERLKQVSSLVNFVMDSILLIDRVGFSESVYISQTNLENRNLVVHFSHSNLKHPHSPPQSQPGMSAPLGRAFILLNIPKTIINSIKLIKFNNKAIIDDLYEKLKKSYPNSLESNEMWAELQAIYKSRKMVAL